MSLPRLGIFTPWDFTDEYAWSGVAHHSVEALSAHTEVSAVQVPKISDAFIDRGIAKASGSILHKTYLPSHALTTATQQSRLTVQLVKKKLSDCDALVSLAASSQSLRIPHDKPLIQVADSSFEAMSQSYYSGGKLSKLSFYQGKAVDYLSSRKSDHYVVASNWSADVLMRDLGLAQQKITVAPFGPGTIPSSTPPVKDEHEELRVLFISSDWKRKGGDAVLAAVAEARTKRKITLTIVGQKPASGLPDWVNFLGRLSRENLSLQYFSHDVLIEPTRASAGGVVITDAIAHGLPVIATHVGGVPTLVQDGVTGLLIEDISSRNSHLSHLLSSLSQISLKEFSSNCRKDYSQRMNWDSWSRELLNVANEIN